MHHFIDITEKAMMKKMAQQALLGVLILILCLSSLSCYTVLRRPGRIMPEEDRYLEEGYSDEWVSPSYLWYDPFYSWYYPNAYSRWRYYYGYPWWWDDYWYWHPDDGGGAPPVDTERHIWDRRRGPDWSTPPSTPSPPSSPSQPRQSKSEEGREPADAQKGQQQRRPDWKRSPDHSESTEQRSKDRGEQQEDEEKRE
jgi:hypothetical protein